MSVTSWGSLHARRFHMWPIRWFDLQWWIFLLTSEDTMHTSYLQDSTTSSLITNLAYRLKPHHRRNMYLRDRLDTCANVDVMPLSVYKLVFQDPDCKTLAPSKLELGTYTTNTVKLVGSCVFSLVHPDTKCLHEVTFYVASNNGIVWLSCVTTLALGLIQPHTRLDYLPPRASLITSSADHPKEDKVPSQYICIQKRICIFYGV